MENLQTQKTTKSAHFLPIITVFLVLLTIGIGVRQEMHPLTSVPKGLDKEQAQHLQQTVENSLAANSGQSVIESDTHANEVRESLSKGAININESITRNEDGTISVKRTTEADSEAEKHRQEILTSMENGTFGGKKE